MKVITLCGSTRFRKEFEEVNAELSLKGNVVFSVGLFGKDENIPLTIYEKNLLDSVHLAKIKLSDEIFVINVGGYIEESTKREITYAHEHGKIVNYIYHGA
ncbi:MAG: hypothetical protein KAS66_06850 [Candidatus Omnitrophica bacterium]|nr:hypothetical protein [Candidatus Omnitrophota bacterium]